MTLVFNKIMLKNCEFFACLLIINKNSLITNNIRFMWSTFVYIARKIHSLCG
jgi:hypothetical protein